MATEKTAIGSELRPYFHITGQTGWINDPNGLIFFRGRYHAFYQYYPHATNWGPMHWGHSVSDDLIHWEYLPIALYPGDEYDKDGCFSGTAIEHNGEMYLMYTGFCENGGNKNILQIQCLAKSSDGINFTKLGIVIGTELLPQGYDPCNFRDPKVWLHEGKFYAIIAAKKLNGKGRILMYSSDNLFDWQFKGDLFESDCEGEMIECPDYVPSLGVLMYSEQFSKPKGFLHTNIHSNYYCIGKMDYDNGRFYSSSGGIVDYGFDFYAAQSFSGGNNPVIMAWMNMWDRNIPSTEHGFAGMMTLPRILSVLDGALIQKPVLGDFLKPVREETHEKFFNVIKDNAVKSVIKIDAVDNEDLIIVLRSGERERTTISVNEGGITFDRSKSGKIIKGVEKDPYSENSLRKMSLDNSKNISLLIVSDEFSIEIFCEGKVLTSSIFPGSGSDGIEITGNSGSLTYKRFEIA